MSQWSGGEGGGWGNREKNMVNIFWSPGDEEEEKEDVEGGQGNRRQWSPRNG